MKFTSIIRHRNIVSYLATSLKNIIRSTIRLLKRGLPKERHRLIVQSYVKKKKFFSECLKMCMGPWTGFYGSIETAFCVIIIENMCATHKNNYFHDKLIFNNFMQSTTCYCVLCTFCKRIMRATNSRIPFWLVDRKKEKKKETFFGQVRRGYPESVSLIILLELFSFFFF